MPVPVPTDQPLLWLAGGLDTRTPQTQCKAVTELYHGAQQPLILLPGASHTPSSRSPTVSDPKQNCGSKIIVSFLKQESPVDLSCEDDLQPITYHFAQADAATAWWGTPDDWGDGAPPSPAPGASFSQPPLSQALPSPAVALAFRLGLRAVH